MTGNGDAVRRARALGKSAARCWVKAGAVVRNTLTSTREPAPTLMDSSRAMGCPSTGESW